SRIRCTSGAAISFRSWGASGTEFNNVTIENNMCWGATASIGSSAVIEARQYGIEWVVRHNTVIATGGQLDAVSGTAHGLNQWDAFEGNVVYVNSSVTVYALEIVPWNCKPVNIDYNVLYVSGGAYINNEPA